ICVSIFIALIVGLLFFWSRITLTPEIYKGTAIMFLFLFVSLLLMTLSIKYGKKSFLILGSIIMLIEYHYYFINIKGFFAENNMTYEKFYQQNPTIPERPSSHNLF